ncbi:ABC transporter permease [Piscibacillus salipiscarius]|uniref:ABC transporter permease n=1 Tax=Piscibacillus salipiscarius TaxID=299480 RepID=UPI0034E2524D
MVIILAMSFSAPLLTDHNPTETNMLMVEQPPSDEHILGTDGSGRDNWSRLLYGSRVSLIVGFSAMFFTVLIGVILGSLSGYYGGLVDAFYYEVYGSHFSTPFPCISLNYYVFS